MDPKIRVLIVDDEPNVRLVLGTALSSVGYEVVEAEDGAKAIETLSSSGPRFDLVLLDLQMPKVDGMEVLSRLREVGNTVPVVILTAHGSIPEAVTAMKLGAIDFLTKPITPEALRRVVAEVIAARCSLRAGATHARAEPRSSRPLEASGVRPGEGQASDQSVPVRRSGNDPARDPRRRTGFNRGRRAAESAFGNSRTKSHGALTGSCAIGFLAAPKEDIEAFSHDGDGNPGTGPGDLRLFFCDDRWV